MKYQILSGFISLFVCGLCTSNKNNKLYIISRLFTGFGKKSEIVWFTTNKYLQKVKLLIFVIYSWNLCFIYLPYKSSFSFLKIRLIKENIVIVIVIIFWKGRISKYLWFGQKFSHNFYLNRRHLFFVYKCYVMVNH